MTEQNTKIRISAETAQAEAAFKSLGRSLFGLQGNLVSFAGAFGGALSVTAFAGFIRNSINLQSELGTLSQKTGIAAKDLAGLKFAADQNGTSLEQVAKATKELAVNMTAAPEKFAKLGINAKDATGALVQMADIVAQMPDGLKKTALLAELMGKKVGPEMAEFLSQGGDALRGFIQRGQEIYKVTDQSAESAKRFKDQMSELEARADGFGIAIANNLLPGLNNIAAAMREAAKEGDLLKIVLVGIGGVMTAMLTDDMLSREHKISKDLAKLRAEQMHALDHRGNLLNPVGMWKGRESALNERNQRMLDLEKELTEIQAMRDAAEAKAGKPKTPSKAVLDLLGGAGEKAQKGASVISGLAGDYAAEMAKKMRELNAPLMSSLDKQFADNLAAVEQRAARAREQIGKLNLTDTDRTKLLVEVNALQAEQITQMEALRAQVDKNNASWQYGAQVALRNYLDEAENVAKQTEGMFTRAFKGMEDALISFVRTGKLDFGSLADSIISDMLRISIQQSITGPLAGLLGGMGKTSGGTASGPGFIGPMPAAKGAWFDGMVSAFANGGVVNSPTSFRFASGGRFRNGVMGESGPEAIMPLARDSAGRLGVRGGGGMTINYAPSVNIDSRTDRADIEALVDRSLQQANAQLVDKLQRQGVI